MSEQPGQDGPEIEVSFADVAAEAPEESVAHETEATDEVEAEAGPAVPIDPDAPEDNAPPAQPTISSLTGGGPVADGSELAP